MHATVAEVEAVTMVHVRRVRMDLVIGVELGTTTLLGYQSLELSQLPNSFQTFEASGREHCQ